MWPVPELNARFAAGDTTGAMALLQRMWGQMVDPSGPYYTGAFWEVLDPDGTPGAGPSTSLAHGWASTPTSALTGYILGIQAVDPGYKTWSIAPRIGDLARAQGAVPTQFGPLGVKWRQSPPPRHTHDQGAEGNLRRRHHPCWRHEHHVDHRAINGRNMAGGTNAITIGAGSHSISFTE